MTQPVRVKSTDFAEELLFRRMEAYEELGRLYQFNLDFLTRDEAFPLDDLLGKDLTVEFDRAEGPTRYFHGYVSSLAQTGRHAGMFSFSAVVHPWFWFLTRTATCRIFQEMTVPEIIKKVFEEEHGFFDYRSTLSATYRKWEYCVQYRETDFNFISRLMEQEGIYYFFEHEDGKDTLVLCDSYGAHGPLPGYADIRYGPASEAAGEERIHDWHLSKSVRTGACKLGAYHFKQPGKNLIVKSSIPRPHAREDYEIYDYPGEYYEPAEGNTYVNIRMEELACDYERVRGETNAAGVYPGGLFDLKDHPREDQNREYLVVSARHILALGGYETGGDGDGLVYTCSFEAMNSQDQYRASRLTPKPAVQGPQTAIVVGPSGEEIWADEYGRVKVKFHWDLIEPKDDTCSCWIRVAQVWAGGGWGGMTIPRIGQEVIVDFIEGDPDRPIITGRVYNDDKKPPYDLPANKTRSTLKSRSSPDGSDDNFNEIRFEDKKGQEEIYIHAEKDHNTLVENNQTIEIGFDKQDPGDRELKVNNDEGVTIGRDRTLSVGRDKVETVSRNKSVEVTGNHGEGVGGNMTISVAKNLTETVALNYAETVGVAMELSVGGAMGETVGANKSQTIGVNKSSDVGKNLTIKVGKDMKQTVGQNFSHDVEKDSSIKVAGMSKTSVEKEYSVSAKKIQMIAKDEIVIKTGKAQISMKKNGDITIKGKKISAKGSGDVILKRSKIKEN